MKVISRRGREAIEKSLEEKRLAEKFQLRELELTADELSEIEAVFDRIRRDLSIISGAEDA